MFPNLSAAKTLTIDVETYDPYLKKYGPGWSRKSGYIVGVAIGADIDKQWYFPVRHCVESQDNLIPQKVFDWLRDLLKDTRPKIGANLIYDIGWLSEENILVNGDLFDVQFAEALLSETAKVSLDTLGKKYLDQKKTSKKLYKWLWEHYGNDVKDPRENIYRAPPRLVNSYAKGDVELPLKILKKQVPLLAEQNLYDLFLRENKQIPILVAMRTQGVKVDVEKAADLKKRIDKKVTQDEYTFHKKYGQENIRSGKQLMSLFDRYKIKYPVTRKGNPSFTKNFLESCKHPLAKEIVEIRKLLHVKDTFLQGYILDANIDGRIHCSFHPLKNDKYGTRSGRYSSSTPNLQNIPYRDPLWGPVIRGLFLPDFGLWYKIDLSQIEYRFLAHYAVGKGAKEVRKKYNADKNTDYHATVQQLIKDKTGKEIERPHTKNINFGGIYGMGEAKLCRQLGLSRKEGHKLFEAYHKGAPFAKATLDYCSRLAQEQGFITTILNRRSRYNMYEDATVWDSKILPYDQALNKYGYIKRAKTYTALNRRLQGSAADYLKEVTLQCEEQGLFKKYGYPLLTVHDELDFQLEDKQAVKELKYIFEHAIKLRVPVLADVKSGKNWGECK